MSPEFKRRDDVSPESSFSPPQRGWLWTSVPPLLLLALCFGTDFQQPVVPRADARMADSARANAVENPPVSASLLASLRNGVLPVSQTLVVSARGVGNLVSLRGEIEGAGTVRGRAPMSGQVSRVLVRAGQKVSVGDRILDISATRATRSSSRARSRQNSAESDQVAAVDQQEALQMRMLSAQKQLQAAQERVAAAGGRLAAARLVVQKLQRGETVSRREAIVEAPSARRESTPPKVPSARLAARDKALAAAEKAQREADKAASRAAQAERAVAQAGDASKSALKKVDEMRGVVDRTQKQFDAGAAKASDVDAARAALEDAQGELNAVPDRVATLRKDAARARAEADAAAANAKAASARAAQALQRLQVFAPGEETGEEKSTPENKADSASDATGAESSSLSVGEAISIVRNAIAESDQAATQARRLKSRVDDYHRQVQETQRRLDSSGRNLESAQQNVLEETIERNLSAVRAPASGTVRTVAQVAQEVSSGDAIVEIGRGGGWQVQLGDTSDAWRALKPGMNLEAVGQSVDGAWKGVPLVVRVQEIQAPRSVGEAATISGTVQPANGGHRLRAGLAIRCSLVRPGNRRVIIVPSAAVSPLRAGMATVAVLMPATSQASETEPQAVPQNDLGGEHRIEWRTVTLGAGNGVQQEILAGLQSGERIALQPAALRAYASDSSAVRLAANL